MIYVTFFEKGRQRKNMKEDHSIGPSGQPTAWWSFSNAPVPFQVKAYFCNKPAGPLQKS